MLGPYVKARGTGGTKISANADLITVETYVQFFKYGSKFKKYIYFRLFEGPSMITLGLSHFSVILSPILWTCEIRKHRFSVILSPILWTCEIRKQCDKNFLSSNNDIIRDLLHILIRHSNPHNFAPFPTETHWRSLEVHHGRDTLEITGGTSWQRHTGDHWR